MKKINKSSTFSTATAAGDVGLAEGVEKVRDKILWLTWKDRRHPAAGGAEAVNEAIAKRLVQNGVSVTFIVAGAPGLPAEETIDGCRVIRLGNRWTVYWLAYRYYKKHFVGFADLVIDEVNTFPFFCRFYVKEKNILFVHQLCRQIWFYQMIFPLSLLGYFLEPLYLRLLSKTTVITVSQSTKNDLIKYGFNGERVKIISEGIELSPAEDLANINCSSQPTILALGSIRSMKRTAQIVAAFELAKKQLPDLQLMVVGDANSRYGQKVIKLIANSPYRQAIQVLGKVSQKQKIQIIQQAHLLVVASVKEGWGLTVTEAASQGVPAVVYNVDGLRDSCHDGVTGLLAQSGSPIDLAEKIVKLISDPELYQQYRQNAWQDSQNYNYRKSYEDFTEMINRLI
ncbi:MAG: glycosyltransferase family 4 protein [Patescibacteria group bacterium]|jgi:glycosyltransferase involved in cell wall biosynthesis